MPASVTSSPSAKLGLVAKELAFTISFSEKELFHFSVEQLFYVANIQFASWQPGHGNTVFDVLRAFNMREPATPSLGLQGA